MLLDNKRQGTVITEIQKAIQPSSKLAVLSSLFSIYGFSALKKELSNLDEFHLMLSRWDDASLRMLAGNLQETRLKNKLDQRRIAKECAAWFKKHAQARAITAQMGAQNLFHIQNKDDAFAVQGSAHFTADGLGVVKSDGFDLNTGISDTATTQQLLQWFNTIWNDNKATQDIKDELLTHLDYLAEDKPANLVYFIALHHIFKGYLEGINEEGIIRSKTGFKDTLVWNNLYKFQRDGVLGAIDKLEKYNGCIIADSVGLGKTFEALAVIKYYELRNDRVLVLCPKRLRENWTIYTVNDKRNLLAEDRFSYDVLNHTDLSRSGGRSGEINLGTINWGNYDLLVIDEFHNFRNSRSKATGATRYLKLMEQAIQSGVKTKVLMLSATPVNSRMNDLKNQVAFITEGRDAAYHKHGLASIDNTLRIAQKKFNQWLKLPEERRKTQALLQSMNFDYFKLLDLLTIARSRKHIEKYYDASEIGTFPERLKPINIKADIDTSGEFPALKDVNLSIRKLNLAAYAPLQYLRKDKEEEYSRKYDQEVRDGASVFRQVDRENNLIHLMRVNLLKRMESSIHSFGVTVGKIRDMIKKTLEQIELHEVSEFEELSIEDIDIDDPMLESYLIGNKTKILIQDMDLLRWTQNLGDDLARLEQLRENALKVTAPKDAKIQKLKDVIADKAKHPINAGNKKVIVFTAFSDTAEYLYKHIAEWAQSELAMHSALITGGGTNRCTIKGLKKDLNDILTHFSPISKERDKIAPKATTEIDILIATDCISEGQNLQDCDMLINYDIHWSPIRIIQRFGRIDRLGSRNDAIQLTNFWPNMELDEYINLESRVSGRMVLLDISATGEENVIANPNNQMNDLEYRRRQMKQLQDSVLDIEDLDGSVSITDMTLNDFRMDLLGFMEDHTEQLEHSPSGFFAAVSKNMDEIVPGAIFCLKDICGKVEADSHYGLAPYYLVYVAEDGRIIYDHLHGKKSLDIFKKLCSMTMEIDEGAVASFNDATRSGKDMRTYQHMLESAIQSVIGKTEEKGIESLFIRGGTSPTQEQISELDDFEVISYLIIREV